MSFDAELALDRLEAELATELPGHMRAFARAYADGTATPAAPEVMRRRGSLELVLRALDDESLAMRALRLVRLLAPLAIDDDPAVASARATHATSWPARAALAAARDNASTSRFQRGHIPFLHWLHGTGWTVPTIVDWPADLEGWHAPAPAIPPAFVERAWRDLADRHGVRGICRIVHAPEARPRAFLVDPGREVIVVIGALATPAARFAALHELGHAVAGLLSPVQLPRMLDEAAASYIARLVEREGDLDLPWFTPIAAAARERRQWITMALDAFERGIRPTIAKPPWALWNDPGAQAGYFVAERFGDRWWAELGAAPAPGAFASVLATARDHVDRGALADRALAKPMVPPS